MILIDGSKKLFLCECSALSNLTLGVQNLGIKSSRLHKNLQEDWETHNGPKWSLFHFSFDLCHPLNLLQRASFYEGKKAISDYFIVFGNLIYKTLYIPEI